MSKQWKLKTAFSKQINEMLRILFSLVISMFELLQHQRDKSTIKHGQRTYKTKIGTKKTTLALQVCFKKMQCK